MRCEAEGYVFTYSSDISCDPNLGPPAALVALAEGADVLVQYTNMFGEKLAPIGYEGGTIGFHQMIAKMAQEANVGTLITTHLGPQICQPETIKKVVREMEEHFKGELIWGRDLLEVEFKTRKR